MKIRENLPTRESSPLLFEGKLEISVSCNYTRVKILFSILKETYFSLFKEKLLKFQSRSQIPTIIHPILPII